MDYIMRVSVLVRANQRMLPTIVRGEDYGTVSHKSSRSEKGLEDMLLSLAIQCTRYETN